MGNLKIGQIVEWALWMALVAVLYVYSFEFDKDIEIYKFGASAWPRAILLLIAIAACGQLVYNWLGSDEEAGSVLGAASDDGAEEAAHESHHDNLRWYLSTFFLLLLPFAYLLVPDWIQAAAGLEKTGLHAAKLVTAGVVVVIYVFGIRNNMVGGILALPILFAAMLQDLGFYSLAPVFALGVMYLFGERRPVWMVSIMAVIIGLLLMLFVSILYVGLPTGNISPFYEIGTTLVTILQ